MKISGVVIVLAGLVAGPALAQNAGVSDKQARVVKKLLETYADDAIQEAKKNKERVPNTNFSASVGREFYLKRRTWQATDYTCSGCHTENPAREGKHIETKKPIKPLAPAANPERFTDVAKVEKNFTEHCMDLHNRDCLPLEKGHFIAYLMSVR